MQLTQEQRIFIMEGFFRTNNIYDVINEFEERFPGRIPPT